MTTLGMGGLAVISNAQSHKLRSSCKTHFITCRVKWQWQPSMLTKYSSYGCLKKRLVHTNNQANVNTILKASCFWIINLFLILTRISIWGRVKCQTTVRKWMDNLNQNSSINSNNLGLASWYKILSPSATRFYRFFQISTATVGNQGVRLSKNRRDSQASRDDLQFQHLNRSLLQKAN